ncbi:START domain-containing protein [Mucilaginibacter ginsenosidivorax]|uniref:Lipid-binding protein n=1 Tax=Mucilaginibacter ginsenosidivorax TaxID=862126 RepID=A0A5B8W3A4_9SPHI|nr:START domain-containing protein [Mucilaginibacter ginsenosidivorax]QEC78324.1 lipid-binding protein [Mucilaginibacter ginsenosidivorax]
MKKKLTLLLLLVVNFAFANPDGSWTLDKNDDGIKVYTRNVATSKVKAIKVECSLDATPSQLVAVLMDISNGDGWVYHTASSYVIKQVSPSELYYYSLVNVPWPVHNRDFIAHIKVTQDPVTKVITVDAPCIADMVPRKPNTVRIEESTGKWIITPTSDGKVKIEYTLHADPGGNIPSWLVNMFVTQGPIESFKKLKVQLQKPAYKNAKLAYIID